MERNQLFQADRNFKTRLREHDLGEEFGGWVK